MTTQIQTFEPVRAIGDTKTVTKVLHKQVVEIADDYIKSILSEDTIDLIPFAIRLRDRFVPEVSIDLFKYLLEISKFENKHKFLVPHTKIAEFGFVEYGLFRNLKERIKKLDLVEGTDYQVNQTGIRMSDSGRAYPIKEIMFTPRAFHIYLSRARYSDIVDRLMYSPSDYANVMEFTVSIIYYYSQYQKMKREQDLTVAMQQMETRLSAQISSMSTQLSSVNTELSSVKQLNENISTELSSVKQLNEKIATDLTTANTELSSVKQINEKISSDLASAKSTIEEANGEISRMSSVQQEMNRNLFDYASRAAVVPVSTKCTPCISIVYMASYDPDLGFLLKFLILRSQHQNNVRSLKELMSGTHVPNSNRPEGSIYKMAMIPIYAPDPTNLIKTVNDEVETLINERIEAANKKTKSKLASLKIKKKTLEKKLKLNQKKLDKMTATVSPNENQISECKIAIEKQEEDMAVIESSIKTTESEIIHRNSLGVTFWANKFEYRYNKIIKPSEIVSAYLNKVGESQDGRYSSSDISEIETYTKENNKRFLDQYRCADPKKLECMTRVMNLCYANSIELASTKLIEDSQLNYVKGHMLACAEVDAELESAAVDAEVESAE